MKKCLFEEVEFEEVEFEEVEFEERECNTPDSPVFFFGFLLLVFSQHATPG
ncbi:hypothetical protein OAG51_01540 [Pirellulaceae bacterium]|nr:hypothetical protein [Pirellulaceae bacterium]